jgi:hypothetical protein
MKLKEGLNEISNSDYHGDKKWLSSSSLKKLLKDPTLFHKEEILGQKEPEAENPAFLEGSLFHSLILEPHKVASEYAFYEGLRKQGQDFEKFKETVAQGRPIVSKPQKLKAENWVRIFKSNEAAVRLISGGHPEFTVAKVLDEVPLKVRADYANLNQNYLVDLKTSGHSVGPSSFRMTCTNYMYFLSAALYCKVFEAHFSRPFDFYFVAVCKREPDCQVYKVSMESMAGGMAEVDKAITLYKTCLETGIWERSLPSKKDLAETFDILEI